MDGAIGVREGADLLAPRGRREDDIGEPGRLGQVKVLDDDEQVIAAQDVADPADVGQ